jgi:hypothetical protein
VAAADLHEGRQPVHLRHFDVERHEVGCLALLGELLQQPDGGPAVAGGADDADLPVRLQRRADQPPYDAGVVHDENRDGVHQSAPIPSSASFSRSASGVKGLIRYSWAPAASARTIWACSLSVVTIISVMGR